MKADTALAAPPPGRLRRLCWPGREAAGLPGVPAEVLAALCSAHTIEEEALALLADLKPRNRDVVAARWGVGTGSGRTLEQVGVTFGITRERVRQIVGGKEFQVRSSGIRLPAASEAVADLDEAGGALPTDLYALLLRHAPVPSAATEIRLLPVLHELGCTPEITFDDRIGLWLTTRGRTRWLDSGEAARLSARVRREAMPYLRRWGAIPVETAERLSPFGPDHVLRLLRVAPPGVVVDGWVVPDPGRNSVLLRMCRKTIVMTGDLGMDELALALRRSRFDVSADLLAALLRRSAEFELRDGRVSARDARMHDVLSPSEIVALDLFQRAGGAMLWIDFLEGMVSAGVSGAMASILLKRPALRQLGPALYGLRGWDIAPDLLTALRRRRAELSGKGGAVISVVEAGDRVTVEYGLTRFALQGVLTAPPALRNVPRDWTARLPGGGTARIRIANGFVWPLKAFFDSANVGPGDRLRVTYDIAGRQAEVQLVTRSARSLPVSREEQILRVLFDGEI